MNELESEGWRAASSASPASDLRETQAFNAREHFCSSACWNARAATRCSTRWQAIRQRECAAAGRTVVGSCLLSDPSSPLQVTYTPLRRRPRGLRAPPPRSRRRRRRRDVLAARARACAPAASGAGDSSAPEEGGGARPLHCNRDLSSSRRALTLALGLSDHSLARTCERARASASERE